MTVIVRAAVGGALVLMPTTLLARLEGAEVGTTQHVLTRVLGVRHLVEAAVVRADPTLLRAVHVIDAVHLASMIGLALTVRAARRPAVSSALLTGALLLADWSSPTHPERSRGIT